MIRHAVGVGVNRATVLVHFGARFRHATAVLVVFHAIAVHVDAYRQEFFGEEGFDVLFAAAELEAHSCLKGVPRPRPIGDGGEGQRGVHPACQLHVDTDAYGRHQAFGLVGQRLVGVVTLKRGRVFDVRHGNRLFHGVEQPVVPQMVRISLSVLRVQAKRFVLPTQSSTNPRAYRMGGCRQRRVPQTSAHAVHGSKGRSHAAVAGSRHGGAVQIHAQPVNDGLRHGESVSDVADHLGRRCNA